MMSMVFESRFTLARIIVRMPAGNQNHFLIGRFNTNRIVYKCSQR